LRNSGSRDPTPDEEVPIMKDRFGAVRRTGPIALSVFVGAVAATPFLAIS
jgi:hypothetical protein